MADSGSTAGGGTTGGRPDSIDPALWGRACWDTMHFFAAGFPVAPTPADQDAARQFYSALVRMLPCADCRDHGSAYVAAKPPATSDRDALFRWTVEYRNAVNARVGAPPVPLARAQVQYLQARLHDQGPPPVQPEATPRAAFDPEASRRIMGLNAAPQPVLSAPRRFGMMPSHAPAVARARAPVVSRAPVARAPPGARAPVVSRAPVAAPRGPPGAARNPVRAPARKKCNCGR